MFIVYVWSRLYSLIQLNFLGIFTFNAVYLPYVLYSFSIMLGHNSMIDAIGIIVGHTYYYCTEIYPIITDQKIQLIKTPLFLQRWCSNKNDNNNNNVNNDEQQHPQVVELDNNNNDNNHDNDNDADNLLHNNNDNR